MNTEISKTNESHDFALHMPQRIDLRHSNKHVDLQNYLLITCGKIYEIIIRTID